MLEVILFLAGVQMMIMLLAAGYRFIDLWYRISDFWPGIFFNLLVLATIDFVAFRMLADDLSDAFIQGQVAYLVFHIVIFWLARFGIWVLEVSRR